MKHLKLYEDFDFDENDFDFEEEYIDYKKLENKIRTVVSEITVDDDFEEDNGYYDGCPFATELLLHHQKDYIDDIYHDITNWDIENLTLDIFRKTYEKMLEKATEKIIKDIKENPSLFSKYGYYIEQLGITIPKKLYENLQPFDEDDWDEEEFSQNDFTNYISDYNGVTHPSSEEIFYIKFDNDKIDKFITKIESQGFKEIEPSYGKNHSYIIVWDDKQYQVCPNTTDFTFADKITIVDGVSLL